MTCICCSFHSLKLAIDVIDASADFIAKTKRIMFVPVVYMVLTVVFIVVWCAAFLCVASLNVIEADKYIP